LFVDNTDLYTWKDGLLDPGELWVQTQLELTQWSTLLNATGGALKPKKCFWYMLDVQRRRMVLCRHDAAGVICY
jgi:hypothetical protein